MRRLVVLVLLLGALGCRDDDDRDRTVITIPTPPPAVRIDRVDFRVLGNVAGMIVRQADSINGSTQATTTPPWFITVDSTRETLFVSLDAVTIAPAFSGTSFVTVQILVNGTIFREASVTGFLPSASISGTYRR